MVGSCWEFTSNTRFSFSSSSLDLLEMVEQEYLPVREEEVKASPHSYSTTGMGRLLPVDCESSE